MGLFLSTERSAIGHTVKDSEEGERRLFYYKQKKGNRKGVGRSLASGDCRITAGIKKEQA